ncbi:hypothetical protein ACFQX7_27110 [Luedemannella flava]
MRSEIVVAARMRMDVMHDQSRFGPEFVAAHRAAHGKRTPEQRQLTYDIAVDAAFESWRRWYDEQFAHLPAPQADELVRRLWQDEHFWPVTFELAAGAAIRSAGYTARYEKDYDGLTPDWSALTPEGELAFFVEVHTDQPSERPTDVSARGRRSKGVLPGYPST